MYRLYFDHIAAFLSGQDLAMCPRSYGIHYETKLTYILWQSCLYIVSAVVTDTGCYCHTPLSNLEWKKIPSQSN